MQLLSITDRIELTEYLSYMHIAELKAQLQELGLSSKAFNKNELIERLTHYALTGKELAPREIPAVSKASHNKRYTLDAETSMLHGAYKNDRATRDFFKQLIGQHFHFTAQGIDWLRERWLEGKPPTYAEFAQEWQEEYERNKDRKRPPKQEWAYIRFMQNYSQRFPQASQKEMTDAWNEERQKIVKNVYAFFKQLLNAQENT